MTEQTHGYISVVTSWAFSKTGGSGPKREDTMPLCPRFAGELKLGGPTSSVERMPTPDHHDALLEVGSGAK